MNAAHENSDPLRLWFPLALVALVARDHGGPGLDDQRRGQPSSTSNASASVTTCLK